LNDNSSGSKFSFNPLNIEPGTLNRRQALERLEPLELSQPPRAKTAKPEIFIDNWILAEFGANDGGALQTIARIRLTARRLEDRLPGGEKWCLKLLYHHHAA
jgi:hypothetical protein